MYPKLQLVWIFEKDKRVLHYSFCGMAQNPDTKSLKPIILSNFNAAPDEQWNG